jgi:hypothetical protein
MGPLLTALVNEQLLAARARHAATLESSLDLERTRTTVDIGAAQWRWQGVAFPYLDSCRERSIYYWDGESFCPASRYGTALVKLVPTEWGPPTFEIDGIKMLVTAQVSPWEDARRKVALIEPRGKVVLDCCAGLGYFAAWCLEGGAVRVLSFEKSPEVLWLRSLNPWSPPAQERLSLEHDDVVARVAALPDASVDAVLHDPPRFGIAGELYSLDFYRQLARVLRRGGRLFHYTGAPNRLSGGRDLTREVARRLREAGFTTEPSGDGVLGRRR